jgi:signal transduction histidine kinase
MSEDEIPQEIPAIAPENEGGHSECKFCRHGFLAILSHELRNPLASLSNSLYVLKRAQPGDPRSSRAMAVMERQIRRLAVLADNLNEAAAIGRGRVELRRVPIDLCSFLHDTFNDHEAGFASRQLAFREDIPADSVYTLADPVRLSQILENLLENAAQFTPAGGQVVLALEPDVPGALVRIRVQDSGVGMEAVVRDRLFLPFSQADTSLARTAGGLGLGLALAKGLVDLHGGSIRAESSGLGCGTTFTVELPLLAKGQASSGSVPASGQVP